jgi:hypothetical protein
MDGKKKELLLDLCDQMDERLECQGAHLTCGNTSVPRTINTKVRAELSLLRACIVSESARTQITAKDWNARKRA